MQKVARREGAHPKEEGDTKVSTVQSWIMGEEGV